MAIDRTLNFGREVLRGLAADCAPYRVGVDTGAGHGDDLRMLRSVCPTAELHGVESYPAYQDELREQGFIVHAVDLERDPMPFEDESVDVVLANQTLEHLKDIFFVLHEMSRVLTVGGSLLIGVPNLASLHNRILLGAGRQPSVIQNDSAHVRGYTRRDLVQLMESGHPGGYVLERWGGSNFYPFPPAVAKPLAKTFPSLAWGFFGRFQKVAPYSSGFIDYPRERRLQTNFYLGPDIGSTSDFQGATET